MEEFYNFLMDELLDISKEFDDQSMIAHNICVLLSVDGSPVPETFYRLYTAPISVDPEIMFNALSYFSGAGILRVNCDCDESSKPLCEIYAISNSDFYVAGMKDACEDTDKIFAIRGHISSLAESLLNVD